MLKILSAFVLSALFSLFLFVPEAEAFFSGSTFEDRKSAYVNDQGRKWGDGDLMRAVWAWLEGERLGISDPMINGKTRKQLITEAIDYITGPGWGTGAFPGPNEVGRMYYQYYQDSGSRVISSADAVKLDQKLAEVGRGPANGRIDAAWCAVANWHWPPLVGTYLYNNRVSNHGQLQFPTPDPQYNCPPSFSYNGHSYVGGNYYDAKTLLRDYLEYEMDDLLRNGTEEDLSPTGYYQFQIYAMALLADFAPHAEVKNKAKMLMDWLVFHYSVGLSAGHATGGHGRHYTQFEREDDAFPFAILFNIEPSPITRWSTNTDLYVSSYRPPGIFEDIVEKINNPARSEGDDYYRVIRGRNGAMGERYAYITPLYNLGGAQGGKDFGTGWELNVWGGSGTGFTKIFSCDIPQGTQTDSSDNRACNAPCAYTRSDGTCWMWYLLGLGQRGSQHRNALVADGSPYLHDVFGSQSWDSTTSVNGWQFYLKGGVAVATRETSNMRAVEIATLGVDYPSYSAFQAAMAGASLSGSSFRTSKGFTINNGYMDRDNGASFKRLEVWEGHTGRGDETKIVSWNNNVMSVTHGGQSCTYDYNNWTVQGSCGGGQPIPTPTPTFMQGDLDRDGDVDIFDYNILVRNFGNKDCGNQADIDGNCNVDIFDYNILVRNFGKKT